MCGIAGCVGTEVGPPDAALARAMADAAPTRGPDGTGAWADPSGFAALGHRRLAVLDLSHAADQPMISPDGRHALVFNGEIYNYESLRAQLAGAPGVGASSGDTAVLFGALLTWGIERTLDSIDGMFAFGWWDSTERTLVLARDRMGEKPLCVAVTNRLVAFGSEVRQVALHPGVDTSIDFDSLGNYLRYKCVPSPQTIYRGIRKVEPGTWQRFRVHDGHVSADEPVRYWDTAAIWATGAADQLDLGDRELVDETAHLIERSVGQRMVSDVPVGAFLSGGIDSRVVTAAMVAQRAASGGPAVSTFTIGSDHRDYDESDLAAATAAEWGTDHHPLSVSAADALSHLDGVLSMTDEPFGDASLLPMFLVSGLARRHVTVALSGDGGDELFGGYERYRWVPRIADRSAAMPGAARQAARAGLAWLDPAVLDGAARVLPAKVRPRRVGQKVAKVAALFGQPDADAMGMRVLEHWPQAASIVAGNPALTDTGWRHRAKATSAPLCRQMAERDLVGYLPDDILTKLDRASMAVSLESRVPLLSPELVRFASRLPDRATEASRPSKWVLREVLAQSLPAELIDAPKSGFGLPIDDWLRRDLRAWAEELLSPGALDESGLAPGPIRQVWHQHLAGSVDAGSELWTVLAYQRWRAANR